MKNTNLIVLIIILLIAIFGIIFIFIFPNFEEKTSEENKINQEKQYIPLLDLHGEVEEINGAEIMFIYPDFNKDNELIGKKQVKLLIDSNTKITISELKETVGKMVLENKRDAYFSDIKVGSKIIVFSDSDMRDKIEIKPREINIIFLK